MKSMDGIIVLGKTYRAYKAFVLDLFQRPNFSFPVLTWYFTYRVSLPIYVSYSLVKFVSILLMI